MAAHSKAWVLLRLRVQIPPGTYMPVSYECYVLSGRCPCFGLIAQPEESYRVCVCVCVSLSVIVKPRELGGPEPLGAVAPWQKNKK